MTKRKLTWSLVAVGTTGALGVGTMLGISSANASEIKDSSRHVVAVSSHSGAEMNGTMHLTAQRMDHRQEAELKARRAKVIKAVLAKFPHARILTITQRKDGGWLVTLVLRDKRVGTVIVDRRFHVGPFMKLKIKVIAPSHSDMPSHSNMPSHPMVPSHPNVPSTMTAPYQPTTADGAQSGHHW